MLSGIDYKFAAEKESETLDICMKLYIKVINCNWKSIIHPCQWFTPYLTENCEEPESVTPN